jgi:hypothetical protein
VKKALLWCGCGLIVVGVLFVAQWPRRVVLTSAHPASVSLQKTNRSRALNSTFGLPTTNPTVAATAPNLNASAPSGVAGSKGQGVRIPPGAIELDGRSVHPTRILAKPLNPLDTLDVLSSAGYQVRRRYRSGWLLLDCTGIDSAAVSQKNAELATNLRKAIREFENSGVFSAVNADGIVSTQLEPTDLAFLDGRL